MSVAGLCQICESKPVEDSCERCGRIVCVDHYDKQTGLCTACLAEFGDPDRDENDRRTDEDLPDGVDEYRF
ncbi:MAG: hypothetical protein ACQETB_10905 [Halobacteriota archaeon]